MSEWSRQKMPLYPPAPPAREVEGGRRKQADTGYVEEGGRRRYMYTRMSGQYLFGRKLSRRLHLSVVLVISVLETTCIGSAAGSACLSTSGGKRGLKACTSSQLHHEAPGLVRHSPSMPLVATTRLLRTSINTSACFCIRCVEEKLSAEAGGTAQLAEERRKQKRGLVKRRNSALQQVSQEGQAVKMHTRAASMSDHML